MTLNLNTSSHTQNQYIANYSRTTPETKLIESELQCLYYLIWRPVKCSDCSQSLRTTTAEISSKFWNNKQYHGIKNRLTCPKTQVFEGAHNELPFALVQREVHWCTQNGGHIPPDNGNYGKKKQGNIWHSFVAGKRLTWIFSHEYRVTFGWFQNFWQYTHMYWVIRSTWTI